MPLLPFGSAPGQRLPSQAGHSGQYLGTDGSVASWSSVTTSSLGTLNNPFPASGAYIYDTSGTQIWLLQVDPTGHVVTVAYSSGGTVYLLAGFLPLPQG